MYVCMYVCMYQYVCTMYVKQGATISKKLKAAKKKKKKKTKKERKRKTTNFQYFVLQFFCIVIIRVSFLGFILVFCFGFYGGKGEQNQKWFGTSFSSYYIHTYIHTYNTYY